jgi:tetratricopeptide (TPR) repeat protein
MIFAVAAALAAAAPAPCPDVVTAEAFICRAVHAIADDRREEAAQAFEQAAQALTPSDPQVPMLYAAAGNSWIEANQPGRAAFDLDKALAGTLTPPQRGQALLDRARAAEAQDDLPTARAKVTEASKLIAEDPFLWFFSAALAIRENDVATAKSSIGRALCLRPPIRSCSSKPAMSRSSPATMSAPATIGLGPRRVTRTDRPARRHGMR